MTTYACETCPMRQKAEANPKSLMSRIWKWHTTWCPGWKKYQESLKAKSNQPNGRSTERLGSNE